MIWLLICIVLVSSFFIYFKFFEVYGLNTFQAIIFNYLTCAVVGVVFSGGIDIAYFKQDLSWLWYAVGLGCLFIFSFFLMAKTAQNVSVAISTVASKTSMIVPAGVSIYLFDSVKEDLNSYNVIGFVLCLIALFLTGYKKKGVELKSNTKDYLLIALVFVGTGLIDSILNVVEHNFPDETFKRGFPIFCFFIAFFIGAIVHFVIQKKKFEVKNLIGGIALGIPNYFSIYTLFKALDSYDSNAAFVLPVLNISVIVLGSLVAMLVFKERLLKINYLGIVVSALAIVLLSYKL